MKKTDPMDKLLQALNDYTTAEGDVVPDGWFTIKEVAEKTGRSVDHVKRRLNQAHKAGVMDKKFFRVIHGKNQGAQRTLFYKAL